MSGQIRAKPNPNPRLTTFHDRPFSAVKRFSYNAIECWFLKAHIVNHGLFTQNCRTYCFDKVVAYFKLNSIRVARDRERFESSLKNKLYRDCLALEKEVGRTPRKVGILRHRDGGEEIVYQWDKPVRMKYGGETAIGENNRAREGRGGKGDNDVAVGDVVEEGSQRESLPALLFFTAGPETSATSRATQSHGMTRLTRFGRR